MHINTNDCAGHHVDTEADVAITAVIHHYSWDCEAAAAHDIVQQYTHSAAAM